MTHNKPTDILFVLDSYFEVNKTLALLGLNGGKLIICIVPSFRENRKPLLIESIMLNIFKHNYRSDSIPYQAKTYVY